MPFFSIARCGSAHVAWSRAAAWHGAELVYRHSPGVMSLSKTDSYEHGACDNDDGRHDGGHAH